MKEVLYTSTIVEVNLSYEKAMQWEEWAVDEYKTATSQYGLNMIPGGHKGLRELHKLGITNRVNITLKERDRAIEEYVRRYPRKRMPAPWITEYWGDDDNYLNYINKREDTLTDEQARQIRVLSKLGRIPEEIVIVVGARNIRQVKDVISGKHYGRVKDE